MELVDPLLALNLRRMGVRELFPVQSALLPLLLRGGGGADLCVSAPTGSGKTLAYALPLVQTLARSRGPTRLRALVLLPSRELAQQVHAVFSKVAAGTRVRTQLSTGHSSLEEDVLAHAGLAADPTQLFCNAYLRSPSADSAVDVLVCTPGRLQDLQHSACFSLRHLRFMVLDEADRLLGNAYHSWVRSLVSGAGGVPVAEDEEDDEWGAAFSTRARTQRLLFSATMTDNPRKLALLGVHRPQVVRVGGPQRTPRDGGATEGGATATAEEPAGREAQYSLPPLLREFSCVCETARRPVALLSLLLTALTSSPSSIGPLERSAVCLVFTSALESTHRLCRLLQLANGQHSESSASALLFGGRVSEVSRIIGAQDRASVLEQAMTGSVRVIVATDHLARGIDLPNAALVLNYDPPLQPKTYVHRVGRTARANRAGAAVTLLRRGQLAGFARMRAAVGAGRVARLEAGEGEAALAAYRRALKLLPRLLEGEGAGRLHRAKELAVGMLDLSSNSAVV